MSEINIILSSSLHCRCVYTRVCVRALWWKLNWKSKNIQVVSRGDTTQTQLFHFICRKRYMYEFSLNLFDPVSIALHQMKCKIFVRLPGGTGTDNINSNINFEWTREEKIKNAYQLKCRQCNLFFSLYHIRLVRVGRRYEMIVCYFKFISFAKYNK